MIKAQNFYYIHTRNSLQSKINLKTKCYNCLHTQLYQINNFKMQTQWKYAEMCVGREWGLMRSYNQWPGVFFGEGTHMTTIKSRHTLVCTVHTT